MHSTTFGELKIGEKFQFDDRGAPFPGEWEKTGEYKANQYGGGTCFSDKENKVKMNRELALPMGWDDESARKWARMS